MKNWKEKLTEFYQKINPDKKDFECYKDSDVDDLRTIRNLFNEEASKYQKLIDEKILQRQDILKYVGKYVLYNTEGLLIKVEKVERKYEGFSLIGHVTEIFDDTIDITLDGDIFVYYRNTHHLEIISEEKYKKLISKHLKFILNTMGI